MTNSETITLRFGVEAGPAMERTLAHAHVATFSRKSPLRMEHAPNEDAGLVWSNGDTWVLAVADGVGGGPAGSVASSIMLDTLATALTEAPPGDSVQGPIIGAIETANATIMHTAMGAATTLCLAEIQNNELRTYHVGDSEVLVIGRRGKLKLRTLSHSPVAYAVAAGVITAEDALHHPERHIVGNVVGSPDMGIEVGKPVPLARYDTVVVATDGLVDNMRASEIAQTVQKGPVLAAMERLVHISTERMAGNIEPGDPSKPDDITIVVGRRSA